MSTTSTSRLVSASFALLMLIGSLTPALAQTAPPLGTAQTFAVLGSSTVTNTGSTAVNGDLGVSPGTSITGFPPGVVILPGTIRSSAAAAQAQNDANTAYNALAAQACTTVLTGQDLGGKTLVPGVYCFTSSAQLSGVLNLNAQGDPNAVFIFQIGSTFTTSSNSSVNVVNAGTLCNVYWQVGSSATIGTGTSLIGNIFAAASVTLNTSANVFGRVVGLGGAVTLDSSVVSVPTCSGGGPPTSFVQVCKAAGLGVAIGTNFTFNVAGTPLTVPAGVAPGGSCGQPMVVPAGATLITEMLPPGTALTSVNTVPAGLLVSSNLAAGTATVTVNAGGQTIVTFLNTIVPVVPTTGFLQVCKIAGAGVVQGTNFTFDVAGTPVTVPAGPAPGGLCSQPLEVQAGQKTITETLPAGTALTSVSTVPSNSLVSSNLAGGTATVTVTAGSQTTVTFLNTIIPVVPTTGFLQVCKIAGTGVAQGTNFTFNVAGTPVTVPAGPAPGGTCSQPLEVLAGEKVVTETLPAGTTLTSVTTLPAGLLVSSNLAAGTATVTVNAGGQTIVTFLNTVIPVVPTTGFVQICKVAGSGVAVGTPFTFNVAGTPVTVPAGSAPGGTCSQALEVPAGATPITETLPAGIALTSVSTLPGGLLVSSNLAAGTATITVNAGSQTIATFLNTIVPVLPTTGFLQICKIAGAGVALGTNFSFDVAGTPVTIPAGSAPGGSCSQPLEVQAGQRVITETLISGTALTSVSTVPGELLVSSNLAAGTATVTVAAGGQTIVTFLNTIIPVIPTTGFLQICKVAGVGVALGTNFTFSVAGTPVIVPAGPAPGGSCSQPLEVQAGEKSITEILPAGVTLTSVSTLPAGLLVSSNLPSGTATVTVNAGGQTIVTFLDTLIPVIPTMGSLQICKIAGTGIAPGGMFSFVVAGASLTVPAGSCAIGGTFPIGASVAVTEMPSGGTVLSAIGVIPVERQGIVNLAGRTVTVTVGTGVTVVSFTNTAGGFGLLKVCKLAGTGIAQGTNFTFTMAGSNFTVPAGFCVKRGLLPVGTSVIISEMVSSTTAVSAISVSPADRQVTVDLAAQTVTATVGVGVTEVSFTNAVR